MSTEVETTVFDGTCDVLSFEDMDALMTSLFEKANADPHFLLVSRKMHHNFFVWRAQGTKLHRAKLRKRRKARAVQRRKRKGLA